MNYSDSRSLPYSKCLNLGSKGTECLEKFTPYSPEGEGGGGGGGGMVSFLWNK